MKWYTFLIHLGTEPFEILIKASSEDGAFEKARLRWGNDVHIVPKKKNDFVDEQYKMQLEEFMEQVNPKPNLEDLEKLKEKYLKARGESNVRF